MKKSICSALVFMILGCILFTSCNPKDEIHPRIQLLGANGKPIIGIKQNETKTLYDTVILLHTKYEDPGVMVSDNRSQEKDIRVENNISSYTNKIKDGYAIQTGLIEIIYTAYDEEGLSTPISRWVRIANPSEIIAPYNYTNYDPSSGRTRATYGLKKRQSASNISKDTAYNAVITTHNTVAGSLRISKIYANANVPGGFGNLVVSLYSEELSNSHSATLGYMGTKSNKDTPFYIFNEPTKSRNFTFREAIDTLTSITSPLRIVYMKIEPYSYTDEATGIKATFSGDTELSEVRYFNEYSTEPYEIILKYVVTVTNPTGPAVVDHITETYVKDYIDY